MIEKNIVGTYNISDQYPVFKSDPGKAPPAIPPVDYEPKPLARVAGIRGAVSSVDPIDQWRQFSERLRDRRLAREQAQQQGQPEQAPPKRPPPTQRQKDAKFQSGYENDMVNISHQETDPMYLSLQRYLSIVNNPVPDEHMKAYETPEQADDDDDIPPLAAQGSLRVCDVMTRRVVCVIESTPIEEVASICNRRGITGVPVVHYSTRNLMGIVSVSDIIRQLFNRKALSTFDSSTGEVLEQQALALLDQPVRDFMIKEVITVPPECTVKDACDLMMQHKIRRVVVSRGDLVKGIFSARDAVRVLARAELNVE